MKKNLKFCTIFIIIASILAYPVGQAYVASYNKGNEYYQNEEYEEAILKYDNALNGFVPKEKECLIRINYALAICKTVNVNEQDTESIKEAIDTYQSAINILEANNCTEYNENAKTLRDDIQAEIDRLKNMQESQTSDEPEQEEEKTEQQDNSNKIEEQIKQLKEEAMKEQRDMEIQFKNYKYEYSPNSKNW